MDRVSACQKSLAEFAAAAAKKLKSFSAAACTWQKILYGLPQPFVEKPQRGFSTVSHPGPWTGVFCIDWVLGRVKTLPYKYDWYYKYSQEKEAKVAWASPSAKTPAKQPVKVQRMTSVDSS